MSRFVSPPLHAVDAGALTTTLDFGEQRRVQDVLLTHGHLDHVWTLPLFLANRFGGDVARASGGDFDHWTLSIEHPRLLGTQVLDLCL